MLSAIERLVTVPMSQPQLDTLASFVFNVGVGAFAQSTLLTVLNAGHFGRVPNDRGRWVHADGKVLPGLVRRRAEEAAMFAGEVRPVQTPPWPGTYLRCPPPPGGRPCAAGSARWRTEAGRLALTGPTGPRAATCAGASSATRACPSMAWSGPRPGMPPGPLQSPERRNNEHQGRAAAPEGDRLAHRARRAWEDHGLVGVPENRHRYRATLRQDCEEARRNGRQTSDQANARRPGQCRQQEWTSPIEGTHGADQFSADALATDSSLGRRFANRWTRLTVSFHVPLTRPTFYFAPALLQ